MRQISLPLRTGRFRSRMTRSGGCSVERAQRLVAAIHDVDEGVEGTLERMLDERRDVLLVLDDENAWRCHAGCTSRRRLSNRGPVLASFHTRPPWLNRAERRGISRVCPVC